MKHMFNAINAFLLCLAVFEIIKPTGRYAYFPSMYTHQQWSPEHNQSSRKSLTLDNN
jgi:hypothetical protein